MGKTRELIERVGLYFDEMAERQRIAEQDPKTTALNRVAAALEDDAQETIRELEQRVERLEKDIRKILFWGLPPDEGAQRN